MPFPSRCLKKKIKKLRYAAMLSPTTNQNCTTSKEQSLNLPMASDTLPVSLQIHILPKLHFKGVQPQRRERVDPSPYTESTPRPIAAENPSP